MRPYYEAYEERYRTIHAMGLRWAGERPTPIVAETVGRYGLGTGARMLELGCGEGRDAAALLAKGYDLTATDASPEAISFCKQLLPAHAARFAVLDFLRDAHPARYDFIYAVAVLHMLVLDADRRGFYAFFRDRLTPDGLGLICTMGDGETEMESDVSEAFELRSREHQAAGRVMVAATSCRMVSTDSFARELRENGLSIIEQGITEALPDFDKLLYAVVRRAE